MPRLMLLSNFDTDLNVNVLRPQGRRVLTVGCRVPAGGALDVCGRLECSAVEARQLIERSPDFVHFRSKRWLSLVDFTDVDEKREVLTKAEAKRREELSKVAVTDVPVSGLLEGPPPGVSDEEYLKLLDKMTKPPKPAPVGDPTPPAPIVPVRNAIIERLNEQMRKAKMNDPDFQFELAQRAAEEGETVDDVTKADTGSTGALDPGAKASLADNIPSTRWPIERLREYAKQKNIAVPDDASKNAILRKIRTG